MQGATSEGPEQRRAQRYATRVAARILVDRRVLEVQLADLSRVGACVRGSALPGRGTEVVLTAGRFEVVATIVWSDAGACGLNFHREIEPLELVGVGPGRTSGNTRLSALAMPG